MEAMEVAIQKPAKQNLLTPVEPEGEEQLLGPPPDLASQIPDTQQQAVDQPMENRARHERRRPRRRSRAGRVVGATVLVIGIGLTAGGAACNPDPVDCELSATAEECWDLNTGVLRPDDGSGIERWTTQEILSGQAGLTHIVGDVEITTDGAVFENKWVDGCIAVKADDVIIKNVLARADHNCAGGFNNNDVAIISTGAYEGQDFPRPTNLTVMHSVVIGTNPSRDLAGIGQVGVTAFDNDLSQLTKGMRANLDFYADGNYVHDLADTPIHKEAFFMSTGPDDVPGGVANVALTNNWLASTSDGANSGAMAFYNEYPGRDVSNIRVEHNYIDGADNGVGIRGGAYINKPGNYYFNFVVKDNVTAHNDAGIWTSREYEAWCNTCTGNLWENNTVEKDDGTLELYPAPTPITG